MDRIVDRLEAGVPWIARMLPSRRRFHELLEVGAAGDRASRVVDVLLIGTILISLTATVLESLPAFEASWRVELIAIEILAVAIFTCEYVLRIVCAVERPEPHFQHPVRGRLRYASSPLAVADLLAVLPFYVSAFFAVDLRVLRVLRLLRILKLTHYFSSLGTLSEVIWVERHALLASYFVIAIGIVLASTGVYVFEHRVQADAFSSVPAAIYWSVVTLSTVGYGDVVPVTVGGRVMSALVIMLGVGTLTIPTGIIATGFVLELRKQRESVLYRGGICPSCGSRLGSAPETAPFRAERPLARPELPRDEDRGRNP